MKDVVDRGDCRVFFGSFTNKGTCNIYIAIQNNDLKGHAKGTFMNFESEANIWITDGVTTEIL